MASHWQDWSAGEMEAHFNPRAAVDDVDARIEDFATRSAAARKAVGGEFDVRYGERTKETLDLHRAADTPAGAPLVLFIHGGYWRALDKEDHSFVVPPLLAAGAVVANVNYDLCPDVALSTIVDEIANAVVYCHTHAAEWGADPDRLVLFGHSAGAHLAGAMLCADREDVPAASIAGVAAITGVYEPQVVRHTTVNEQACISEAEAAKNDLIARPPRVTPRMLIGVGGDEPAGWIAQSAGYATVCRDAGVPVTFMQVRDTDHFSILDEAVDPGLFLAEEVVSLFG